MVPSFGWIHYIYQTDGRLFWRFRRKISVNKFSGCNHTIQTTVSIIRNILLFGSWNLLNRSRGTIFKKTTISKRFWNMNNFLFNVHYRKVHVSWVANDTVCFMSDSSNDIIIILRVDQWSCQEFLWIHWNFEIG